MTEGDKEDTTADISFESSFLPHVASTETEMFRAVYSPTRLTLGLGGLQYL